MRAQGWIQDLNASIDRRLSFKAELLAPHEKMSPRLCQRLTKVFQHLEQAAQPLAIAEHVMGKIRTMACAQLTPSRIMTFFLERRAGRYFVVRFYNEKGEQRGKLRVNDVSRRLRIDQEVSCLVLDRSYVKGDQMRYWFEPLDLIPDYWGMLDSIQMRNVTTNYLMTDLMKEMV
jgi:hypothetical protein